MKRVIFLLVLLWWTAGTALAGTSDNFPSLDYAGFAFSGNAKDYHYSSILAGEDGGIFDQILNERIKSRKDLKTHLNTELVEGNLDSNSVACALVQESVEFQPVYGKVLTVIVLQSNVLIFNPQSKSLVASYPLRMRFTYTNDQALSEKEIEERIKQIYHSNQPDGFFNQWLDKLDQVHIKNGAIRRAQVIDITFTPEASKLINGLHVSDQALKTQMANLLESALSEQSKIAIIPNAVGHAVSKMALHNSNGRNWDLVLPPADYGIVFGLRDFAFKRVEKDSVVNDIFRVKASITIKDPSQPKVYLDENIYDTKFVSYTKQSGLELNQWDQFYKTSQSLIFSLSKELLINDDDWLHQHASKDLESKPAFLQINKLIQELR